MLCCAVLSDCFQIIAPSAMNAKFHVCTNSFANCRLWVEFLPFCHEIDLPAYALVYLSIYLSICRSIYQSKYLSIYLSAYLTHIHANNRSPFQAEQLMISLEAASDSLRVRQKLKYSFLIACLHRIKYDGITFTRGMALIIRSVSLLQFATSSYFDDNRCFLFTSFLRRKCVRRKNKVKRVIDRSAQILHFLFSQLP